MIKAVNIEDISIMRSVEDLTFGQQRAPPPFNEVPSSNCNFFCDAINFGLRYNVDLLYTTAVHMFTLESLACMDPSKVIKLATAYTNIPSAAPRTSSSWARPTPRSAALLPSRPPPSLHT